MATPLANPIDLGGSTLYVQSVKQGYTKGQGGLLDGNSFIKVGASKTATVQDQGKWFNLDIASGSSFTLPSATGSGNTFNIFVGTTVTSNNHVVQTNGTDTFAGTYTVASSTTTKTGPATGTNKVITMNGSTTGGLQGSWLICVDIAANLWMVEAALVGTGTGATPMS
jgi:hypothetical protein